jgi:hypothetical protein
MLNLWKGKNPTPGKPIYYYCRSCQLHRVCFDCWKKAELTMLEMNLDLGKQGHVLCASRRNVNQVK